jgi:hypothetical protein
MRMSKSVPCQAVRRAPINPTLRALVATAGAAAVLLVPVYAGKTADNDIGMTRAFAKANGSGIVVTYRVEGEPKKNAATEVVVVLTRAEGDGPAAVRFAADAGLILRDGPLGELSLAAGSPTTIRLSVVPESDGLRYLNVFTSQNGRSSSTSIPIQVGSMTPKGPGSTLKTAPDGARILSHPVK